MEEWTADDLELEDDGDTVSSADNDDTWMKEKIDGSH